MKRILSLLLLCFLSTGCASNYAYKSNHAKAEKEYVYSTGDANLITAYHNGDVHGLGIDLTSLDVVFNDFGSFSKQLGALGLDVITALVAYEAYQSLESDGDSSNQRASTTSGGDVITFNISGTDNEATYYSYSGSAEEEDE